MPRLHLAIFSGVLAAALGLAWFAWRSLDSQRFLLEQGAEEAVRREAAAQASAWRARFEADVHSRLAVLPPGGAALGNELARLESSPGVAAAFAFDRTGRLVWPPPPEPRTPWVEDLPADGAARAALAEGYRLEFVARDPEAALSRYAAAAAPANGRTVRVEASLQLAALSARQGNTPAALEAWTTVLNLARFAEPQALLLARVARIRLIASSSPLDAEAESLRFLEEVHAAEGAKFGEALQVARSRAVSVSGEFVISEPGKSRRGVVLADALQARRRDEARASVDGRVPVILSRDGSAIAATLDGRRLAAWRTLPSGGAAGCILEEAGFPAGPTQLEGIGASWPSGAPGVSAPVPGVEGLSVVIPPSDAAAREVARQRAWLAVALAALLGTLAAGLAVSFRSVRREAELARLKSDFVATVSHELKTPLALVRMYAETLAMGRVEGRQREQEYLAVIVRESERLTAMIERILDFSRVEKGETTWKPRGGDLAATVRQSVREFAAGTGPEVAVDAPGPVHAAFDPDAVSLALRNLLENAAKYSEGAAAIAVRVRATPDAAQVVVEDRGIGVADSERDRIFERFYRSGDPRARRVKGTGLGLALVAHVMKDHRGRARCEPRDGGGSRFILEFPLSETPA